MNIHEYNFKTTWGSSLPMHRYDGQPVLMVNTASECGFTPQYAGLQRLWNDYSASGLVVLGIPCNDFGEQEPGSDADIAEFCSREYRVSFPMTSKQVIIGAGAHPLWVALLEEFGDDVMPRWNFHKYLFDRGGQLIENWPSKVVPGDPAITHQVERNLQSWVL